MTSKTSCSNSIPYRKYILENIRQRGWLMVLSLIAVFLIQPIYITMHIENFLNAPEAQNITSYLENFPYLLNGNHMPYLALVIGFLAVACAVSGFAYLHHPEKSDFFHSFPLKRTQWFHISYISGLLIFLIPYLLSSFCTMVLAATKGILVSSNFAASVLAIFGGILGFLILYNTGILAMMLTGKLIAGTLASCVLIVYGSMIALLFSSMVSRFLDTPYTLYLRDRQSIVRMLSDYLSPIALFEAVTRRTAAMYKLPVFLLITAAIIAGLGLLARYLYQKRPLEAAGNALAYPKTASAIKILIAIPAAISFGFFADSFHYNAGNKWVIFFSMLAVVLLCGIIEFIYTQDLQQIFKRKCASLISIAGVAAILAIMHFDLFGYDTWLPNKAEIESMAVYSDSYLGYLQYPAISPETEASFNGNNAPYYTLFTEAAQCKEFDSIYRLAEEGIQNHNIDITPSRLYKEHLEEEYTEIVIRFNKTNGKSVYRTYVVQKGSLLDCLNELCQDEAYRRTLFPAFHIADTDIKNMTLQDLLSSTILKLTEEEQAALLKAYQTDTLQTDIYKLQEDTPIGSLIIKQKDANYPSSDPYNTYFNNWTVDADQSINLYVYDTYKHTIKILESYGYTICPGIAPEDVIQLTHTTLTQNSKETYVDGTYYPEEETETITPVTDPAEINRLLDRIAYSDVGIVGWKGESSEYVEIWLKGDLSSRHYSLLPE